MVASATAQQRWVPIGPDGGDVRSLAYSPKNPDLMYLGTSAGYLYRSSDGGANWTRFARLGAGHNYVLDNIAIDPRDPNRIYIAAWDIDVEGGELFRSTDAGKTWTALKGMRGKSIRALAVAPSDSKTLVAGALDGVFRSRDGGETWELVSPVKHEDIRNIESIAIDPTNPEVIYAGTWHLPWKTMNGGKNWSPIHKGMIDDSDVFSIIIDPRNPSVVYASACSGIYKSTTGGELFSKVQGIPFSARRTRVLQQDPNNSNVVYAGTTEGLWKTEDAGKTWKRMTASNLIINDVMVDPRNSQRVLLATDRSGILASRDAGQSFMATNRGFAHRQVTTVLSDHKRSDVLYAGVINDKDFGGVFTSSDNGRTWSQISAGLGGRDVFTLAQDKSGVLIAGTNSGLFRYDPQSKLARWVASNKVVEESTTTVRKNKKAKPVTIAKVTAKPDLTARVTKVVASGDYLYASTNSGLYRSKDGGRIWSGGAVQGMREIVAVQAEGDLVLATTRQAVFVSQDGGKHWLPAKLPARVTVITGVTIAANRSLWVAAREGAFRSRDAGETWEFVRKLPANHLASIVYDAEGQRLLTTSFTSTEIFESSDNGNNWRQFDSGWAVRNLTTVRGRLLATTAFDGLVVQPEAGTRASAAGGR